MPSNAVDICNIALGHLGEASIVAITDDNTRARACNKHYDTALESTLRSHRWNFAQKRGKVEMAWVDMSNVFNASGVVAVDKSDHGVPDGSLVHIKGTTFSDGSFKAKVTTPDVFRLEGSTWRAGMTVGSYSLGPPFGWSYKYPIPADCLRVLEVNDSEQGANDAPWIIEGDFILTDSEECRLVYVSKIEDVSKFDPLFVDAFALALAVRLTETIRGTTGKTAELTAQYERITAPLARRVDANEARRRKPLRPINSLAIRARFSGHVSS